MAGHRRFCVTTEMRVSVRRCISMGKGWAKGLTAATDPRVARRAEGHRGKLYVRRTPLEDLRWSARTATTLPLAWSDPMAYVVGAHRNRWLSDSRSTAFDQLQVRRLRTRVTLLGPAWTDERDRRGADPRRQLRLSHAVRRCTPVRVVS